MGIGISRKQRVFVVLEDTQGTIQFPAAKDFIRPAGDAMINQSPDFVDSEEKQDTLDVLDRFQNAKPPGEFTLPMYMRLVASSGTPQGSDLFVSMQGSAATFSADLVGTSLATTATVATIGNISTIGNVSYKGVIEINSEKIFYGRFATTSATQGIIGLLERGWEGTTAVGHAAATPITQIHIFYKQQTDSPSFSIWVETDHFIQGLAGSTVNSLSLGVNNEGAVTLNFSGQGMNMVWAGTTRKDLSSLTPIAATWATVVSAKAFSVGAFIQNKTIDDNNSGAGYQVVATNATTNRIQVTPAIAHTWTTGATISGYLPTAIAIGTAIESRFTDVEVDGVAASIKNTDLSVSVPKQYITDEVGTTYPEDYMEQVREITSTMDIYFREENFTYFKDGYDGNNVPLFLLFGNTQGMMMGMYMRNVSLTVPSVSFSPPAVNLSMPFKALGEHGEDSLEVIVV
jgi:hypothetical protein